MTLALYYYNVNLSCINFKNKSRFDEVTLMPFVTNGKNYN